MVSTMCTDGHILSGSYLKTGEEEVTPTPARICVEARYKSPTRVYLEE